MTDIENLELLEPHIGQPLAGIELTEHILYLKIEGRPNRLALHDNGQDCCEHRYMTTDDDLSYYVGSKLLSVHVAEGPELTDGVDDCHDTQFLIVTTAKGAFTIVSHNEHNGYYGGFDIDVMEEPTHG